MFKYCPECGAKIRKDAEFCEGCGQKLRTIEDIENEIRTKYMGQLEEKIRKEKDQEIETLKKKLNDEKNAGLHYGWRAILHKYINYIIAIFYIALLIVIFIYFYVI